MSMMKDFGRTFLKYSEKIVNKTDDLTQIARFNIEIKKALGEIEDTKTSIGDLILKKYESGDDTISLSSDDLTVYFDKINQLKEKIEARKKDLEAVKIKNKTNDTGSDKTLDSPESDNNPGNEDKSL